MSDIQPLNPLTLPLRGERLIEASAGTGKTYTIGILYLRLLLGLGAEAAYLRPLGVDEILVVTFTEAATEELRSRIRDNIHALRLACIRGESKGTPFADLMAQIPSLPEAAAMLLAAERQMDDASIHTIHGFCQRMLTHHAFESGMLFEQTLVQDEQPLRRQAAADFWRRYCYPLPLPVARAVSQLWSCPEQLLSEISPYLHGEAPQLRHPPQPDETLLMRHQQIIERIGQIKNQWRQAQDDLLELINQSGVDKRSYSSKHLPNWLAKVSQWAAEDNEDYQLPNDLKRFGQTVLEEKTKKGQAPQHPLFVAIDQLYQQPLSLADLMLARAISEIRSSVQQEKLQRAEMGFDDLLSRLDAALQRPDGPVLAQAIRSRYPVAMIDEFQDTDPQQYRIFHAVYHQQADAALLPIGDPKQAIYAFRGADIFTYMRARDEVSAHYSLNTNWRSSVPMVNSVNRLFAQLPEPFMFKQIPFAPVVAAEKNQALSFEYQGQTQPALQFWLQPGEGVGVSEYQQLMARQCAAQIRDWLAAGQQGTACLVNSKGERHPVLAADIAILVRSRREATLIREALAQLAIPSVYKSNRDSVFATVEAKDLLWLLQAVLTPEKERSLRSAMATSLLGLDALTLHELGQDEAAWDALVDEFDGYRRHWQRRGVLPMLRAIMKQRQLAENLLASPGGERRLTDIMHIGELLQEASAQLDSEHALVRWLAQQVTQPDHQASQQQLRLESDRNLVEVITIHKSKGLEYPLVWLPFIANYREQKQALYHDRQDYQAVIDLQEGEDSLAWAEEERLAEDMRLLYVALTRSVYHCSIGIAPLFQGNRKKQNDSDLHLSALGYLVQQGQAGDANYLQQQLTALSSSPGIALNRVAQPAVEPWQPPVPEIEQLAARQFTRQMQDFWRVTSYTGLQQHGSHLAQDLLPRLDIEASSAAPQDLIPELTPHSFPRGAGPGTFLHSLFETLDFSQPVEAEVLSSALQQQGLDLVWLPMLQRWMSDVLTTPLTEDGISLAALSPNQMQAELQFYLPIEQLLQAKQMDALLKAEDPLSARCPPLEFAEVQGLLKGFIDLVFCWQGKYYLLDYKSNWLGEEASAYSQAAMEQAMALHRYDLQYQLYTLALHRYLRHRLPNYDYQQHFGGVIYLFLRGVDRHCPGQGIFYTRPTAALVEGLDGLFSGKTQESNL